MLTRFKNWWNRHQLAAEERDRQLTEQLQQLKTQFEHEREIRNQVEQHSAEVEAALEEVTAEVQMHRERDAADQAKYDSTEPWVEVKSADYHDVKGLQIQLDWNDAFIQYLKDSGMSARDEDTLVQKWLAHLYQDLVGRLEQQVIEKSDKPRINDYE